MFWQFYGGGGRDPEMENPKQADGGFSRKIGAFACAGLLGELARGAKVGERWGKGVCGQKFFFWNGMGESCGEGGCWFFFWGGPDQKIVELSKTRPLFNQCRNKRSILL
jgi:hypothetical protein